MSKDASLKRRFTFKLSTNLAGVVLGLVTVAFVPRVLGPANFGKFDFITNNFKLIFDTLALQVPVAYFNWISRKGHKEETDVATGVTLYFSLGITAVFALLIAAAILGRFNYGLWPEVEPVYLWEAFFFTVIGYLYQLLVYLSDGKSLTVGLEKIRLLQNVLKCVTLVGLVLVGLMNLHAYFLAQIAVVGATILLSAGWLRGQKAWTASALKAWAFPHDEVRRYRSFAVEYARPLSVLMLSGFAFLYFDRWFLQLIGGATQQGFFGLSDRLGQIAFVFTSAMTPLLTREFAHAYEEKDREQLLRLFMRIRVFLFIAAATSAFLSVESDNIVAIVGGDKYRGAVVPIALMALFPIHQTFGQLSGSLMIATGQTGLYAKIGILMMVVSLPITYFCIAPSSFIVPGMALGATGLAIKMLVWQVVATNVQLFCNTRFLKIRFREWIGYQIAAMGTTYGIAWIAAAIGRSAVLQALPRFSGIKIPSITSSLSMVAVSALGYLLLAGMLLLLAPGIAGTSREELLSMVRKRK